MVVPTLHNISTVNRVRLLKTLGQRVRCHRLDSVWWHEDIKWNQDGPSDHQVLQRLNCLPLRKFFLSHCHDTQFPRFVPSSCHSSILFFLLQDLSVDAERRETVRLCRPTTLSTWKWGMMCSRRRNKKQVMPDKSLDSLEIRLCMFHLKINSKDNNIFTLLGTS